MCNALVRQLMNYELEHHVLSIFILTFVLQSNSSSLKWIVHSMMQHVYQGSNFDQQVCVCMFMSVYACVCRYMYMCVFVCVCTYVCVYVALCYMLKYIVSKFQIVCLDLFFGRGDVEFVATCTSIW